MSELTVRDLIVHIMQKDYKIRSNISTNLSIHIEKLYDNYIIGSDEKKRLQKNINEIVNMLNKTIINQVKLRLSNDDKKNNFLNDQVKKYLNINSNELETIENLLEIMRTYKINLNGIKPISFKNIDISIKNISTEIGLGNIDDILKIFISSIYKNLFKKQHDIKFLDFLNKYAVPLSVNIQNYNETNDIIKIKYKNTDNDKDEKYEMLLENFYEIEIGSFLVKKSIIITCYFELDSINSIIRSCQLTADFLHERKNVILDTVNLMKHINKNFRNIYVKNLTYCDILCSDTVTIKKKIIDDYHRYIKYSGMTFKNIMKEFLEVDFKTKFLIIKFLLMGPVNSINVAGLLFGLTKDYKEGKDSKSKPTLISDIIFKNLNYPAQMKLKKSNILLKQELDKLKTLNYEDVDLKKQIITNKNMPQHIKKLAIEKLEEMKSGSSEYYKQLQYVKILIDYPWCGKDDDDLFTSIGGDLERCRKMLEECKNKMDKKVYGHDECKNVIIELLGKWFTNPKSLGKAIGLVGPPGVGKTLFAKALGDVLGIPFTQVNVGGVEDGSVLAGHSFTYSGAQPGLIVRKMIEAGSPRSIMFFDELDKASTKHGINEVFNILIHVTDPNSNSNFNDKFFQEVTFPLNKVLFIFSFNDADKVDKILLDRMELIDVSAYNMDDKIKIVKGYLLDEITNGVGIDEKCIDIEDDDIGYIVESFTFEAGVRDLKRKLESILLKMNLDRIYNREPFGNDIEFNKNKPIVISRDLIDRYLKKPKISVKKIHSTDEIGMINGLYATTSGSGGIIPILVYKHRMGNNKFSLKLTGSQGKVMKESVLFAFTIAMNLIKDNYITQFLDSHSGGLHIHTPDGATPKDGPSAGSAFTTAFISRILGKRIKKNIAMTGEIEANGNVTAIGGLEYKLMGAKRAGVNLIFVPKENEDDFKKITDKNKTLIDDKFKIIIVNHITDILDYALIDDKIVSKLKKDNDNTYEKTFDWTQYIDTSKNSKAVKTLLDKKKSKQIKKQLVDNTTESESENENDSNTEI
jgi:endopeptidase La